MRREGAASPAGVTQGHRMKLRSILSLLVLAGACRRHRRRGGAAGADDLGHQGAPAQARPQRVEAAALSDDDGFSALQLSRRRRTAFGLSCRPRARDLPGTRHLGQMRNPGDALGRAGAGADQRPRRGDHRRHRGHRGDALDIRLLALLPAVPGALRDAEDQRGFRTDLREDPGRTHRRHGRFGPRADAARLFSRRQNRDLYHGRTGSMPI